MTREVAQRRKSDPDFTFQPDAVHPNADGHWFIAQQLIRGFGDADAARAESPREMLAAHKIPSETLQLVRQRMNVLRDAYLGAAGHKRPGVRAGLPIETAEQRARTITARILKLKEKAP